MYVPVKSLWQLNAGFSASDYLKCPVKQVFPPNHAPPGISVTWALKPSRRILGCPDSNRSRTSKGSKNSGWSTLLFGAYAPTTHKDLSPIRSHIEARLSFTRQNFNKVEMVSASQTSTQAPCFMSTSMEYLLLRNYCLCTLPQSKGFPTMSLVILGYMAAWLSHHFIESEIWKQGLLQLGKPMIASAVGLLVDTAPATCS